MDQAMPPDLVRRVNEANEQLDNIERRLLVLEAEVKSRENVTELVERLRHDFSSARMVIKLLIEEIDQRLPVQQPQRKKT